MSNNNSAFINKSKRSFLRLIQTNSVGFTLLLLVGLKLNWQDDSSLWIYVIVLCIIVNVVNIYLIKKNKVRFAAVIHALTGFSIAIVFNVVNPNLSLLPIYHVLSFIPLMIFLGNKYALRYILFALFSHSIITFVIKDELVNITQKKIFVESTPEMTAFIVTVFSAIILIISIVIIRNMIAITKESLKKEEELSLANKNLSEQVFLRQEAENQLKLERDLLSERVFQRTMELEVALKRKDEFLAMMSHELRTPLHTILSRTQAVNLGVYGSASEKHLSVINSIEQSGTHLLALINDVLDVSKITSGNLSVTFEPIAIDTFCEAIVSQIMPIAKEKNLELDLNVALDDIIEITADKTRLRQILINLISNAIKFTPENKKIGFNVTNNMIDETISFEIWDEGIGIPQEKLNEIFQPFFQIESDLARSHNGTGLGLALVQKLTELHNGSISVNSIVNQGTQFHITLPISQSTKDKVTHAISTQEISEIA